MMKITKYKKTIKRGIFYNTDLAKVFMLFGLENIELILIF